MMAVDCSVPIKDTQLCSPVPGGGAVCDWFLTSNQQILTPLEWTILQAQWGTYECTPSATFGTIKAELEQLCASTKCSYPVKQAIKSLGKFEDSD